MEKNNDPAFPTTLSKNPLGMTKREYAAIQIMAGYAASVEEGLAKVSADTRAQWAVAEADALFTELAK